MCFKRSIVFVECSFFLLATITISAEPKRPNILMIAVDDLRPELNCYGKKHIHSPNIDRLAREGVRFDRAYCQVAVCGASRASLLSGCRPETTNCWDYKTPLRSKMPDVLTLPQHFRMNGYQTTFLGKVYHSSKDDPQGWSLNSNDIAPKLKGMGRSYVKSYARLIPSKNNSRIKKGPATENGGDVRDDMYVDGHNANRAVKVLGHLASQNSPFFLAVGFYKPHLPFVAPQKYWDMYDRNDISIPSRKDVIDGVPYAASSWGELKNYPDIPNKVKHLDDNKTRELIHGYYAATTFMDAQVGKLLRALDELNLRDNTIVILWGDHGWYLGEFGDWCKHSNYEIATRVPLIVSAPALTRGQSSRALVEFVDIYPTLCELAGIDSPAHCQGASFRPIIESPDRDWKAAAFSQYFKNKPGTGRMLGTSVRTPRYRYTEWRQHETGRLDSIELIDFENDPEARINVAQQPQYKSILHQLAELASQSKTGVHP